jgi:chromosomal replication initiation ATPase DnaA
LEERILPSNSIYQKFKKAEIVGCTIEIKDQKLLLKCPNENSTNTIKQDPELLNYLKEKYKAKEIILSTSEEHLPIEEKKETKGFLNGKIKFRDEYIYEPYFRGPSNEFAYKSISQAIASGSGVIVIVGPVGVGKSHMLHRFSYKAYKNSWNVYINSTSKFITQLFNEYTKGNYDITEQFLKNDLLALDDFQVINRKHLVANIHDVFFDILNSFIEYDKLVLLSCDRHPRDFEFLHKRITDRLWSVRYIEDPDKIVMNKYIKWFKRKYNLHLKGFNEIILNSAHTMRMLKEFLYIAKFLEESNMLTIENFEKRTKVQIKDLLSLIVEKLLTHYSLTENELFKSKRKTRAGSKVYSIAYYLLHSSQKVDDAILKLKFDISDKNKMYYLKRGEQYFKKEIEDTPIGKEIKVLVGV